MQKDKNTYIIRGGEYGFERLEILSSTLEPFTKEFLLKSGLKKGMKVLDLGCGSGDVSILIKDIVGVRGEVFAIDIDETSIKNAKEKARLTGSDINFLNYDINAPFEEFSYFDFIYMRFILSHLKNPELILKKCSKSLKVGGIMAIEDVDFEGHFCYPPNNSFDNFVSWYTATAKAKGVDPFIGKRIFQYLLDLNLTEIDISIINPAFQSGVGKLVSALTFQNIAAAIIDAGIAPKDEVIKNINLFEEFTFSKSSLISLSRIVQTNGVKM